MAAARSVLDENARHINGTLPHDPFEDVEPMEAESHPMPDDEFFVGHGPRARGGDDSRVADTPANHKGAARVWTPATVLEAWRREGPLVHEPTGIEALDELTGGGPVYGTRWYVIGAPDAAKTALIVQLGDTWNARGIDFGLLAVDEEPGDVFTRIVQRRGWRRRDCEERNGQILDCIGEATRDLSIRMYGDDWTIEAAAAELAMSATRRAAELDMTAPLASPRLPRAALFVDSLQTVRCDGESEMDSLHVRVSARVRALRAMATRHRLIVVATSEMGRSGYRDAAAAESANDMALAKESGAVEYSARVLLSLRSVKGEGDLIEARVAKNKHGPSGDRLYLRIDRTSMTLTQTEAPPEPDRTEERSSKAKAGRTTDAARVLLEIVGSPGLNVRALYAALRARHGSFSDERADAGLVLLGDGIARRPGSRRAVHLHVDGTKVPREVLECLKPDERVAVAAGRPPPEAGSDAA